MSNLTGGRASMKLSQLTDKIISAPILPEDEKELDEE